VEYQPHSNMSKYGGTQHIEKDINHTYPI